PSPSPSPPPLPYTTLFRSGLVNRVAPAAALMDEAMALARRLAEGSPLATALAKRALAFSAESDLEAALAHEATLQGIAGRSADQDRKSTRLNSSHQIISYA